MALHILFDPKKERAVFLDTVTERPVNHEAFIGNDADEQAENFCDWLEAVKDNDPREYPKDGRNLDEEISEWRVLAFDANEDYVGTVVASDD